MRVFYNEGSEGGTAVAEAPKAKAKKVSAKHQTTTVAGGSGKSVKKAVKKKAAKPEGEKKERSGLYGIEREKDLPWSDKKVSVFKALKALKCFGVDSAKGAADVAAKIGGEADAALVRHYSYHAKAAGLIEVVKGVEEIRGVAIYLTKKGAALDPVAEFKKQEAEKAAKSKKKDKE